MYLRYWFEQTISKYEKFGKIYHLIGCWLTKALFLDMVMVYSYVFYKKKILYFRGMYLCIYERSSQCPEISSKIVEGLGGDIDEPRLAGVDKCWVAECVHMGLLCKFTYLCIYLKITITEQEGKKNASYCLFFSITVEERSKNIVALTRKVLFIYYFLVECFHFRIFTISMTYF